MRRTPDCQFEVRILEGRMICEGVDVDDIADCQDRVYEQRKMSDQLLSATLALRAGIAIGRLSGRTTLPPGVHQLLLSPAARR